MEVEEITKLNIEKYLTLVASLDPELYRIKLALVESKVNAMIIPAIIRGMANIAYGTGYGKIEVYLENGKVSVVKSEEKELLDLPAILNEENI